MHDRRRLAAGEVLFRAGESGQVAFLVESGAIEIYLERGGRDEPIALLGADELFGEMALAGDHTRTASARAVGDTELLVVTHEMLAEQMARAAPVLRHLLRVTLARSRDSLRLLHHPAGAAGEHADRTLAAQRLRTEQQLRQALYAGELELHYQPIVELDGGRIAGFESLIRWHGKDGRLIPPSAFIGVAEDSELIVEIGRWIVDTVAAALVRMAAARPGAAAPFCSINLSPRQFDDPQLAAQIGDALARHALAPKRLRLEITESAVFGNLAAARQLLEQCRALGCPVLVDDFGTGYSALSYLHRLPIDAIKLDRSFIDELGASSGAAAIVQAMARLAADLGLYTVAEGIETAEQAAICAQHGVSYGQGFHFSRGVPLDAALALL